MRIRAKKHLWNDIPDGRGRLLALRTIIGYSNFIIYIAALTMIPLFLAVIIHNLAPFWTSLLAYFINKEPIIKFEYAALLICFICVIGVAVP